MISVGFFEKLKTFKRDEIPDRIIKAMDKFVEETPEFAKDKL
jgi:hypothetical protein